MGNEWSLKKERKDLLLNSTDPILYYHPFSFYSQKILFALHEKHIKCTLYEVDITHGEQFSDWFLELNPKGEVPVLQNGTLIIPSSGQIISYLEDNFQGDKHPRLLPLELDDKVVKRIIYFHRKISRLPIGAVSMGSFIHSDLCSHPKIPFIGLVRNGFLKSDEEIDSVLENYAKINPLYRETLLSKAQFQRQKRKVIHDREEFLQLVEAVESVLSEVEEQLAEHKDLPHWWLCSEQFTIADISLGTLLYRLHCLGFESYFWANNKKPNIEKYFQRITERSSFIASLPTKLSTLKTIWSKTPALYKVSAGSLGAILILSGIMMRKL